MIAPARGVRDLVACIKLHLRTSSLLAGRLEMRGCVLLSAISLNSRLFVGTITIQVNGTMITVTMAA